MKNRPGQRTGCQPLMITGESTPGVLAATPPTLWASGLTTITACTFDRQGNFWATEMFAGGLTATPPGDTVRIPFTEPTTQDHFGFGQLPVPGGIAQGPDGAMYITIGAAAPGVNGGVLRIDVSN
jgi:hypothetical protein